MADLESALISELAANNTAPSPDGLPALSSPNIVYSEGREFLASVKRDWNRRNATVTSGGSANAQTLTYTSAPPAMIRGQRYAFIAGVANTGPMTLSVNGLTATAVQVNGAALVGGELRVGLITEVLYDGTNFQIIAGSGVLSNGVVSAGIYLNNTVASGLRFLAGQTSGSNRWALIMGNATAEGGGNSGSDLVINRYTDGAVLIDSPLGITRSSGAVAIKGTSTNDSAAAGFVGEIISSNVTSPVTLTSGTTANLVGIVLTPGDWDCSGEVWIAVGTGGASLIGGGISTVSATLPGGIALNQSRATLAATFTASNTMSLPLRPARQSLTASTTIYLVALATFPSGTTTVTGCISARRMR